VADNDKETIRSANNEFDNHKQHLTALQDNNDDLHPNQTFAHDDNTTFCIDDPESFAMDLFECSSTLMADHYDDDSPFRHNADEESFNDDFNEDTKPSNKASKRHSNEQEQSGLTQPNQNHTTPTGVRQFKYPFDTPATLWESKRGNDHMYHTFRPKQSTTDIIPVQVQLPNNMKSNQTLCRFLN
jgi:hypothetical protein